MRNTKVDGIILAAGFGTRLRPLTDKIPKAIVEVADKPLIFYAIENMIRAKVSRVVINTHYLPNLLEEKVKSVDWPIEIIFSNEPTILGTGGGIKQALSYLPGATAVLVQNADGLIQPDMDALFSRYFSSGALSAMVLKTVQNPDEYGAVLTDIEDRVRDINGKVGFAGAPVKRRMFCGLQLLDAKILEWMPPDRREFCILNDAIIPSLKKNALVVATENEGFFCDVGTPERLELAQRALSISFAKSVNSKTPLKAI